MEQDEELNRKLFQVAQLYYERNYTQKEISAALDGVPQPTISRWLDEARRSHLLKVRVEANSPLRLEAFLCQALNLRECRIAWTHEAMGHEEMCERLAQSTAKYLIHLLKDDPAFQSTTIRLGLSGGTTLSTMLRQMPSVNRTAPTELFPAFGFLPTESEIRFENGVVIVSEMRARIENSVGYWLPLPPLIRNPNLSAEALFVQRMAVANMLENMPIVADLLHRVKDDLDILFTGMGSIACDESGNILADAPPSKHFVTFASNIDARWRESEAGQKIIGDLSFLPFGEDGPVELHALKQARMGIEWESLRRMVTDRKRVVLVCGGQAKHETLHKLLTLPSLRGTVNVLITDIIAARFLKRRILASLGETAESDDDDI